MSGMQKTLWGGLLVLGLVGCKVEDGADAGAGDEGGSTGSGGDGAGAESGAGGSGDLGGTPEGGGEPSGGVGGDPGAGGQPVGGGGPEGGEPAGGEPAGGGEPVGGGEPGSDLVCAADDFTPCGGDVVGTWTIADMCLSQVPDSFDNPLAAVCPDSQFDIDVDQVGTMTFTADTFQVSITETVQRITVVLPMVCLPSLGIPAGSDCSALTGILEGATCVAEGDACRCITEEIEPGDGPEPANPYVIEGTNLVISDEDGTTDVVAFCVQGDTAEAVTSGDDPEDPTIRFTLQR